MFVPSFRQYILFSMGEFLHPSFWGHFSVKKRSKHSSTSHHMCGVLISSSSSQIRVEKARNEWIKLHLFAMGTYESILYYRHYFIILSLVYNSKWYIAGMWRWGESGDDVAASVVMWLRYIHADTKGWLHVAQNAGRMLDPCPCFFTPIQFNSIHLITSHRIRSRCIAPKSISFISHIFNFFLKKKIENSHTQPFTILPHDMKLNIFFSALLKIVNINIIILLPPADWNLTIKTFSISIKYGCVSARASEAAGGCDGSVSSNPIPCYPISYWYFRKFSFFLFLSNIPYWCSVGGLWSGWGWGAKMQRESSESKSEILQNISKVFICISYSTNVCENSKRNGKLYRIVYFYEKIYVISCCSFHLRLHLI